MSSINFGGLDIALRVDNTALCVLKLDPQSIPPLRRAGDPS